MDQAFQCLFFVTKYGMYMMPENGDIKMEKKRQR